MEDLPLQVDLKIAYIDSSFSGRIGSVNGAKVKKDGPEGMVSIGVIPGGLCNKQFICRAWVSLAFFDRGGLWANANSSAEEIRQSNWLVKQQRKLSKKYGKGSFEK
jgi:hypothetical protein